MKRVRNNKSQISQWLSDDQGNVKMAIGYKEERIILYLVEDNSTRELKGEEIAVLLRAYPRGFSEDDAAIYFGQRSEIGSEQIIDVPLAHSFIKSALFSSQVAPSVYDLYSPSALRRPGITRYIPATPFKPQPRKFLPTPRILTSQLVLVVA